MSDTNRRSCFLYFATGLMVVSLAVSADETRHEISQHAGHPLGKVDFPVTCTEQAQVEFNRAVALLHHMTYPSGTTDPDGDALSYLWFQYPEPGSYPEPIELYAENLYRLFIRAPEVDEPETTHFILAVTDKGTPPLTRYKRVIVNIVP